MFRGDKESVQLEKIFKLTGYPQGEVLQLYNNIEGFTNFNTEELKKSLTNQFAAKYLFLNDKSGDGGHNISTPLHHHHHLHNSTSSNNYYPIQSSKEVNYKVFDVDGLDLLQRLLDISPKTRITAKDAMDHPYFQKLVPSTYDPIKSVIFPHSNVSYSDLCCILFMMNAFREGMKYRHRHRHYIGNNQSSAAYNMSQYYMLQSLYYHHHHDHNHHRRRLHDGNFFMRLPLLPTSTVSHPSASLP